MGLYRFTAAIQGGSAVTDTREYRHRYRSQHSSREHSSLCSTSYHTAVIVLSTVNELLILTLVCAIQTGSKVPGNISSIHRLLIIGVGKRTKRHSTVLDEGRKMTSAIHLETMGLLQTSDGTNEETEGTTIT